ncbi:hypothetical protein [Haloarcula sebkhae]|uniref:Uncharacterized protein n=2 Tax=Haloarcula sebkhae TaxID=932660 RepID=A0ACC6VPL4_9EURY|nr:hypothetical protein [Haloarcula sebkhae]GGK63473.1 hypothetical protein GCM10009067_14780 [Haloarcula sebkhae]
MIPLQTIPQITPDPQVISLCLLFFMGGLAVPTRYGMQQVEGFGRLVASQIPTKSKSGVEPSETEIPEEGDK